jgi:hypothetical protein
MGRNDKDDPHTIIAEFLDEKRKEVVVHPNEFLIVVRDGAFSADGSLESAANLEIIKTEGKYTLREKGKAGSQQKIRALLANGSQHVLEFRTLSPEEVDLSGKSQQSFPVISQDGMVIPMRFTVHFMIDPDNATNLFRLTQVRTVKRFTTDHFREMIQRELLANVIAPVIETYDASDIKGNESVRQELLAKLRVIFQPYSQMYGIHLAGNEFTIQWDLTAADIHQIRAQQKEYDEALQPPNTDTDGKSNLEAVSKDMPGLKGSGRAGRDINEARGLSGLWIVLLLGTAVLGFLALVYVLGK